MQAQTEPQTSPALSSSRLTCTGSIWAGSSIGSSTVSNPQSLNCLNSLVLLLLKGEVNRKVFSPSLIGVSEPMRSRHRVKTFSPLSSLARKTLCCAAKLIVCDLVDENIRRIEFPWPSHCRRGSGRLGQI